MCQIISYFPVFNCLPKSIIGNIRCFFVTQKYWLKTGFCVTNEDKVYAVGEDINRIFYINETDKKNFVLIPELCHKSIEEFFDGSYCIFAKTRNNQFFSWGRDLFKGTLSDVNPRPLKLDYFDDKNIIEISCSSDHCLALSGDGMLYGWGDSKWGQLGSDLNKKWVSVPIIIEMNEEMKSEILSIHCNSYDSFVITISGDIYELKKHGFKLISESNFLNQKLKEFEENKPNTSSDCISDGNKIIETTYFYDKNYSRIICRTKDHVFEYNIISNQIRKINSETFFEYFLLNSESTQKTIHLRDNQLFVIKYNNTSEICVSNVEQFCEDFERKTAETLKLRKFRVFDDLRKNIESDVKCYYFTGKWDSEHSSALFVMSDSTVFGFGFNSFGKLGFGHQERVNHYTPVPELCNQNIEEFYEGFFFMFARNDKNQIFGWGRNESGQLGRGHENGYEYLKPYKIDYFDDKNIIHMSCSSDHCLALSSKGEAYGWGHNSWGQLGFTNGTASDCILTPIKVNTINPIKHIYCEHNESFLIDIEGKVIFSGRIYGIPTEKFSELINQINSPNKKIVCNKYFICILTDIGSVYLINIFENTIKRIESEVIFTDIDLKCEDFALLSEDCVYVLIWFKEEFISLWKTDYLNFYDYYLNHENLIYKTIHITSDGFLMTKDIKINQNYNKTNDQNVILIENKNIFDDKFAKLFEDRLEIGRNEGYNKVFKAKNKLDNKLFAIKRIEVKNTLTSTVREVKILSELKTDFVVQYITAWIEAKLIDRQPVNYAYIQMQLCSQSLRKVIKSLIKISDERYQAFKYFICCELFRELTECVDYLHSLTPPIIHRDLKPENVLISDGSDGRFLKLCDFGLAKQHLISIHSYDSGTIGYMAPEVREMLDLGDEFRDNPQSKYNLKSDIYSLATIVCELFNMKNKKRLISREKRIDNIWNYPVQFNSLVKILSECLADDPEHRPTANQLLKRINEWTLDFKYLLTDENISEFRTFLCNFENQFLKSYFENKLEKVLYEFITLEVIRVCQNVKIVPNPAFIELD